MAGERARFRSPFSFYVPALLLGSLAPAAILFLVVLVKEKSIAAALKFCVVTFLVVLPVMFVFVIIITYTYVIEVDDRGIYSFNPHNSWKREFIEWKQINSVTDKIVFGLKYVLVTSDDDRNWLWLQSEIIGKDRFGKMLASRLGNENPLVRRFADV